MGDPSPVGARSIKRRSGVTPRLAQQVRSREPCPSLIDVFAGSGVARPSSSPPILVSDHPSSWFGSRRSRVQVPSLTSTEAASKSLLDDQLSVHEGVNA